MRRSNVDFPLPDDPSSAMTSPGSISRSMSRNTVCVPKVRPTLRTETRAGARSVEVTRAG